MFIATLTHITEKLAVVTPGSLPLTLDRHEYVTKYRQQKQFFYAIINKKFAFEWNACIWNQFCSSFGKKVGTDFISAFLTFSHHGIYNVSYWYNEGDLPNWWSYWSWLAESRIGNSGPGSSVPQVWCCVFFFLFFFLGEIQDDNYFLLNKTFQNNITYHTWGLFVDIGDASIWRWLDGI